MRMRVMQLGSCEAATADVAEADVIRSVQRNAVPGQRAIGGRELVAARAGVGRLLSESQG